MERFISGCLSKAVLSTALFSHLIPEEIRLIVDFPTGRGDAGQNKGVNNNTSMPLKSRFYWTSNALMRISAT
jgi:hypothetical protein